jgi:hypothetical protein
VQLLSSNRINPAAHVVITTIQRLYSILRGEPELAEDLDETSLQVMRRPVTMGDGFRIPTAWCGRASGTGSPAPDAGAGLA